MRTRTLRLRSARRARAGHAPSDDEATRTPAVTSALLIGVGVLWVALSYLRLASDPVFVNATTAMFGGAFIAAGIMVAVTSRTHHRR